MQAKTEEENCVAIIGFFQNTETIKDIKVYLFLDNTIIDSVITNNNKDFGFTLKRDKNYSVQIIKKGYYNRLVSIDTHLPKNQKAEILFVFEFEIQLLKEVKDVDDFFMDFPIATISYNDVVEKFVHSKKYTAIMQQEIKKIEEQFKVRRSN